MIKHVWSIVCRESNVDPATNNISIDDAYENIQVTLDTKGKEYKKGLSVGVPFDFELVSLFYRDAKGEQESTQEFVTILDPKGVKLGEVDSKVVFREAFDRMRNVIKFNSMPLTLSGTYLFQVHIQKPKSRNREPVTVIPVDIQVTVNGEKVQ